MHLIREVKEKDAIRAEASQPEPFGPGFSEAEIAQADRLEIWGTNFSDLGPDYCEFKLFANGKQISTRRIEGY